MNNSITALVALVCANAIAADVTNLVANPNVRIVNGRSLSISDPAWDRIRGKIETVESGLIIVRPWVTVKMNSEERRERWIENREAINDNQRIGAYVSPGVIQPYTKQALGDPVAIKNYPGSLQNIPRGTVFKAMPAGSVETSFGQIQLFDCGVPSMTQVVSSSATAAIQQTEEEDPIVKKAKAGDAFFQIVLAEHYRDGDGVAHSLTQARFWAQCACTNKDPEATNLLAEIEKKMGIQK